MHRPNLVLVLVLVLGPLENPSPAADSAKPLAPEIEALVKQKEGEVAGMRKEAIKLLSDFLADSPPSDETAEALFKLAELTYPELGGDEMKTKFLDLLAKCEK